MDAIYHELGHSFISYIFNGEYYNFGGVTMKPEKKLHPDDIAYTISTPVDDSQEKIQENQHRAATVDGLFLLAGAAGQTFLLPEYETNENNITPENFNDVIDLGGTKGDFDAITRASRPYGWYLNALQFTKEQKHIRHVRIMNVLKKIFQQDEIYDGLQVLRQKLVDEQELDSSDFAEVFTEVDVQRIKEEIETYISEGLPGLLLIQP